MARYLKTYSSLTLLSSFKILNKVLAFIFACFCVASGQIKNNEDKEGFQSNYISIQGKVFNSIDTSLIRNIKVALYELRKSGTLYGIINAPIYDTTSEDGSYSFQSPPYHSKYSAGQYFVLTDFDGDENGSFSLCTLHVDLKTVMEDTVINIYVIPDNVPVTLKKDEYKKDISVLKSSNVTIKLNNVESVVGKVAEVFSVSGKLIRTINIGKDRVVKFEKENIPKGVYLISIPTVSGKIRIKVNID